MPYISLAYMGVSMHIDHVICLLHMLAQLESLMVQTGKLRTLDLSNNQMGPVCAEVIALADL